MKNKSSETKVKTYDKEDDSVSIVHHVCRTFGDDQEAIVKQ